MNERDKILIDGINESEEIDILEDEENDLILDAIMGDGISGEFPEDDEDDKSIF